MYGYGISVLARDGAVQPFVRPLPIEFPPRRPAAPPPPICRRAKYFKKLRQLKVSRKSQAMEKESPCHGVVMLLKYISPIIISKCNYSAG
eukprot:scaffold245540_cov16-Prasinocladus_malaysianus.AAC.1